MPKTPTQNQIFKNNEECLLTGFGTQKTYESYRKTKEKQKQSPYTKWGKIKKIHLRLPLGKSIIEIHNNVKETKNPNTRSLIEGFIAEGKTLGKKYPATPYNAINLEMSSKYLESSLYCEATSLNFTKITISNFNRSFNYA